jgi:hypothetical protein
VLTKDMQDMFLQSSLIEDAEMMYLLNRSELSDEIEFEASRYNRDMPVDLEPWKEQWVKITPHHFQVDGEITVQDGSTLADDDEGRANVADQLFQAALQNPAAINIQKARDEFLVAHGKRHELKQWIPIPPRPQPPEMKLSTSIAFKAEDLNESEKRQVMQRAGIDSNPQPVKPPGAAGPVPIAPPPGGQQ